MRVRLDYPAILDSIKTCLVPGRTESHALLVWFLQHYFRLDEVQSQDTVCDGPDDKGIDGIYVDENLEAVFVFQCKLVQNPVRTLGDTQLKEFVGTLDQFRDPTRVSEIAVTTTNAELTKLLTAENVAQLVRDGFTVRGVFVTNIDRDANAVAYISGMDDRLRLFDKGELETNFIAVGPTEPVGTPVTFDVFGYDCAQYQIGDVKAVLAPLRGNELIKLDGIASSELFAWNVRGSLGRTKVNKDIGRSIDDPGEHRNFLLYHNGLTILCQELTKENDKIVIAKYSVVNGCQSLTSLYDHRFKVTDDLRVLTRLIELPPEHELAEKITHHSNNQNPINARDLQSNSIIQRRLQAEIAGEYTGQVFYRIKRGEPDQAAQVIDNDEAGRLLLAFDLKQPWTCHQTYKILDELHADIFARPEVNAHRIVSVADIHAAIIACMEEIENRLLATYRLTQYFLLYLVRQALDLDEDGKVFCADPARYLLQADGRARLRNCAERIVRDIIIDLNAEVRERQEAEQLFDYKRELKSPNSVRELSRSIIPQYQKAVSRGRACSFAHEWENSAGD
jgi:AIPR protein